MAGRKYSTRYAKFQVSGYASRGGTRFGANEKTYLKKYFFGYVFRSRYVFFLPTKVVSENGDVSLLSTIVTSGKKHIFFTYFLCS
jgi:hypothetical protein